MDREQIITALHSFARQRSGMDFRNYGDVSAYRSEQRSITKDLHDARTLLRAVQLSSISDDTLKGAFRAFSGRLSIEDTPKGVRLKYCTGQYFPTEYRKAVCAVAAAALWDHYRESFVAAARPGESAGDAIRRCFKREFGRSIANRWFS